MSGRKTAFAGLGALLCCVGLLAACSQDSAAQDGLEGIKARGTLVVLTRNAPTTYYIGSEDKPTGPEYEMATAFAQSLGVDVRFVIKDSVGALLNALASGEGDMIAAGITRTAARAERFGFGESYQTVRQQVVCHRGGPQPSNLAALAKVKLEVISESSYSARLAALQKDHPELEWKAVKGVDTETLLRRLWQEKTDCVVADSDIVAINRRYYPNLTVPFDLGAPEHLAWATPKGAGELDNAINTWLAEYRASGKLADLIERYYGYIKIFNYVDLRTYTRRIQTLYPKFRSLFQQAAKANDLPALTLASQAYQESHWDPQATSPTGVRGIMMLTQATARELGVKDRLNPRESIDGGAKYLANMEKRLPESIHSRERTWFALAAYNIGLGHVRDARTLAKRIGKDPDDWGAMRQVLPKLAEKRYYQNLPHGYARGLGAVRYVQHIRNFTDILHAHTHTPPD